MKILILDSGTLINLSMNGLLYIIPELKKISDVRFIITDQVKYEIVDRPSSIPRFELGALRIKHMIAQGFLELPQKIDVAANEIKERTAVLKNIANTTVQARGKFVDIVSDAEISCLALSEIIEKRNTKTLIAIDERTTRVLAEKPENLQKLMSQRLHFNVTLQTKNLSEFKKFRFIRSTELVYVAFKKNLLQFKDPKALEAVLYATKYKGAAVSFEEINSLKKM